MSYWHWLTGITATFFLIERIRPWRRHQRMLRPGLLRDLGFLAINGHVFSALTAALNGWLAAEATGVLQGRGVGLDAAPLRDWPWLAQLAALLLVSDLVQYGTHRVLHGVPFLWTFHKVHHAITTMDFIGNFRFHWMEIVVYKLALWLPLSWLGASGDAAFAVAVVSTIWGDFNHSNLDVGLGWLGYVFNNPRMHLWHHDASSEGGQAKNFGVTLSLWDHVFGTAYWPRSRCPEQLGYPGMDEMPPGLLGELLWPATRPRAAGGRPA